MTCFGQYPPGVSFKLSFQVCSRFSSEISNLLIPAVAVKNFKMVVEKYTQKQNTYIQKNTCKNSGKMGRISSTIQKLKKLQNEPT